MTNAMPSLQITIKLSYGWRPLALPCFLYAAVSLLAPRLIRGREYVRKYAKIFRVNLDSSE